MITLKRVYRVDDDCDRAGVTHAAYWDPDAEYYWLICRTRQPEGAMFVPDSGRFTGCNRCQKAKLARYRLVRWAARTWEG